MIISRKTHMMNRAMSTPTTTDTSNNITNNSAAGESFFSNLVSRPSRDEELKHERERERLCEAKITQYTVISTIKGKLVILLKKRTKKFDLTSMIVVLFLFVFQRILRIVSSSISIPFKRLKPVAMFH